MDPSFDDCDGASATRASTEMCAPHSGSSGRADPARLRRGFCPCPKLLADLLPAACRPMIAHLPHQLRPFAAQALALTPLTLTPCADQQHRRVLAREISLPHRTVRPPRQRTGLCCPPQQTVRLPSPPSRRDWCRCARRGCSRFSWSFQCPPPRSRAAAHRQVARRASTARPSAGDRARPIGRSCSCCAAPSGRDECGPHDTNPNLGRARSRNGCTPRAAPPRAGRRRACRSRSRRSSRCWPGSTTPPSCGCRRAVGEVDHAAVRQLEAVHVQRIGTAVLG